MNDQIADRIAEHVQRMADALAQSLEPVNATRDDVVTMRDQFALMIVAGHDHWSDEATHEARARDVYAFSTVFFAFAIVQSSHP